MPSEMTLHERLADASVRHSLRQHPVTGMITSYTYIHVSPAALAAIERDMLAPWRERVAALEADNGRLKQAAVSMSDTCDEWADSYHALKARSNALRDAGEALRHEAETKQEGMQLGSAEDYEIGAIIADWMVVARTYYAADRAGETNDDGTRGSSGSHCGDDCDSNPADRGVGCGLVDQSQAVAPSPTDAAAEGDALGEMLDSMTQEQFDIGIHDGQLGELFRWKTDLERWREGVDERLAALEKAEQHRVVHNITAAGMANLVMWINDRLDEMNEGQEQRLDALSPDPTSADWQAGWAAGHEAGYRSGRESALRGPEVTEDGPPDGPIPMEAMKEAYEESFAKYGSVRAGLSSAMAAWRKEAALRAGGVKA